ncbi:MAG: bifunctional ADP-dependent NAD(P)H-hydrate dehydratase/NAD(P)H-hydrate epimerase [Terriglobia bacterium]|nr:MAG: bifunctional ADP-dependent NAD(P)H-hydrate dehydratase/NAD(P)H-hydrate epimerase [Terriglobia bacterium]
MKVLTAAQMREVDRRTIEAGIPGIVLMENAGLRVVEFLEERFAPLAAQRIAVLCGKGNNGGDGMVVARQLWTRFRPAALDVVLLADPQELKGDAATNFRMLQVCGCPVVREIPARARHATLVVDALLGTGVTGPASGPALEGIRQINSGFPLARVVVAVDIPSGMPSDSAAPAGEIARADHTVTFTSPKVGQVLPPNCDGVGELLVRPIGSPPELYENDDGIFLSLIEPAMFRALLAPRPRSGHKGTFGHVLVVAGSRGKTGAAAMSGMSSLRAGAGLVTVASSRSAIPVIAGHAPELMTEPLEENEAGGISRNAAVERLAEGVTVIAMGPGMGRHPDIEALVTRAASQLSQPMVLDADALTHKIYGEGKLRILTPHPGEMARLSGKNTQEVQADRVGVARAFAVEHGVVLVLKGQRTAIAFPDGAVWINPTGTPALGTGGTGDVLTGLIAGFLAQFPEQPREAVAAAVYLGGLAGEIGARELGEKCLLATDLLRYLPRAMEECAGLPHGV